MKNPHHILFTLIASVLPFLLFAQTDALHINANGNVGIHTIGPKAILQINGGDAENNNPLLLNLYLPLFHTPAADQADQYKNFRFLQTNIGDELKQQYGFRQFNVGAGGVSIGFDLTPGSQSGDALYVNGRVGLGTTSPTSPLQVARAWDLDKPMLSLDQSSATWNTTGGFDNYCYLQTNYAGPQTDGNFKQFNVGPGGVAIGYAKSPGFNSQNALYVNGRVGIGTTDPESILDVNGVAHFGGNTTVVPANKSGLFISWNKTQGEGETDFYNATGPQGDKGAFKFWNINKAGVVAELMAITEQQYVGIGTGSPDYPLDVRGMKVFQGENIDVRETRQATPDYGYGHPLKKPISIKSEYGIMAGWGYYLVSDRRIKKSFIPASNLADLDLLNRFKVVSFQYKDSLAGGAGFTKGFIAQDVEKLYPQAVNTTQDFIPSVYQNAQQCAVANGRLTVTLVKPHQLATGDVVRLITNGQGAKEMPVTVVGDKTFTVAAWDGDAGKVFVYGKRVTDFKSVDYQQIFALGISATQQLSKEVDTLKAENEQLKKQVEADHQLLLQISEKLAGTATRGNKDHATASR